MTDAPKYHVENGVAYPIAGTFQQSSATEALSGGMSGQKYQTENVSGQLSDSSKSLNSADSAYHFDSVADVDPVAIEKEFLRRWQVYIQTNFRNTLHVQRTFGCSDKTARNWWSGVSGPHGGKIAIAKRVTPVAAERQLFAVA